jgi:hypothetical protein
VGFESTTPAFERAKIIHALASAASVIGMKEDIRNLNTSLLMQDDYVLENKLKIYIIS